MRELSVYYCPKCGRYGYYQLVRNTTCPNCDVKMSLLDMRYSDFVHLNRSERDNLIIQHILNSDPSLCNRIITADRACNQRKIVAEMMSRIQELETENLKLNDTVEWMHQTIWDLLAKNKELERRCSESCGTEHTD